MLTAGRLRAPQGDRAAQARGRELVDGARRVPARDPDDAINGGDGNDTITGRPGNDSRDIVAGGDGTDTCQGPLPDNDILTGCEKTSMPPRRDRV